MATGGYLARVHTRVVTVEKGGARAAGFGRRYSVDANGELVTVARVRVSSEIPDSTHMCTCICRISNTHTQTHTHTHTFFFYTIFLSCCAQRECNRNGVGWGVVVRQDLKATL